MVVVVGADVVVGGVVVVGKNVPDVDLVVVVDSDAAPVQATRTPLRIPTKMIDLTI